MKGNIAIDGPAGAGKSTIAKIVASKLGLIYIDTGAMYRTLALHIENEGIDGNDEEAVVKACIETDIGVKHEPSGQHMLLNGEDVSGLIRTERISDLASAISVYEAVRAHLVRQQQKLAADFDVVMDGRDIGTVVLPDAPLKIYLDASPEERARRRMKEYAEKGIDAEFEDVLKDIKARDHRDMTREHSPLRKADDAVVIDATSMTIDEVVERVIGLWK